MVLKPSEESPLDSMIFTDLLHESGVPAGVFNLVNGYGPVAGVALSAHPDIDMMSFTGSNRGGVAVAKAAADTVKRVDAGYHVIETVPRTGLWRALTPQVFQIDLLTAALTRALAAGAARAWANLRAFFAISPRSQRGPGVEGLSRAASRAWTSAWRPRVSG